MASLLYTLPSVPERNKHGLYNAASEPLSHMHHDIPALQNCFPLASQGRQKVMVKLYVVTPALLCADPCRQLLRQQSGLHHEQHLWHTRAPRSLPGIRWHPPLCGCLHRRGEPAFVDAKTQGLAHDHQNTQHAHSSVPVHRMYNLCMLYRSQSAIRPTDRRMLHVPKISYLAWCIPARFYIRHHGSL